MPELLQRAEILSRSDGHITYKTDRGETTVNGSPERLLSTVVYTDGSQEQVPVDMSNVVASVDFSAKALATSAHTHIEDADYMADIEPEAEDRIAIGKAEALAAGQPEMAGFTRDPYDHDVLDAYFDK